MFVLKVREKKSTTKVIRNKTKKLKRCFFFHFMCVHVLIDSFICFMCTLECRCVGWWKIVEDKGCCFWLLGKERSFVINVPILHKIWNIKKKKELLLVNGLISYLLVRQRHARVKFVTIFFFFFFDNSLILPFIIYKNK